MIAKVVIENGTKKLVPLASGAQIGSGLPLGTIIPVYSNVCPSDYLPCNGVAFDENQYPALYNLLGDNHTPDLRECTLKMIGESGRTVGAHVKSGGLAVGEFIDDRLQEHQHEYLSAYNGSVSGVVGSGGGSLVNTGNNNGRSGATTEVKAVGVNYVIKATSGLETGQQEYVLQALNEAGSYSTQEVATGKRWIDGKMIYRCTFNLNGLAPQGQQKSVSMADKNVDTLVKAYGIAYSTAGERICFPYSTGNNQAVGIIYLSNNIMQVFSNGANWSYLNNAYVTVEYTKTTN